MTDALDLADYRRRVADLYAAVRAAEDHETAWMSWRVARDQLFATHPQSPIPQPRRAGFPGSPFAGYDPKWRLTGRVEPSDQEAVLVDHSDAGSTRFVKVGTVSTEHSGDPINLDLYWLDSYGGGLFLPFRDQSNGATTYGGGRYLLDAAKGADLGGDGDELILDFNFSYHPSCVWDPHWSCPLSPPGNTLSVAVTAGELLP